jgi:hypothetical protein
MGKSLIIESAILLNVAIATHSPLIETSIGMRASYRVIEFL